MEEAKAAAYYDELTRKGEGAARFKQGLGFSSPSSSNHSPSKPSSSPSSLLSNFVRATSPNKADKKDRLETIKAKLRSSQRSSSPNPSLKDRRRSFSRERQIERDMGSKSRSRATRRRSKSCSDDEKVEYREDYRRDRNGRREIDLSSRGYRSRSPSRVSSGRDCNVDHRREGRSSRRVSSAVKGDKVGYARAIEGYSQMTASERVKAKMKLQLSQTAAKDSTIGMSSGWERFDFNKDAPLDDDAELEVAEDDASLVKKIGNTFRFSAMQAKREEEIKAAHDDAIFGTLAATPTVDESESSRRGDEKPISEKHGGNLLLSDKVLAMKQGSWRDRAAKCKPGCGDA